MAKGASKSVVEMLKCREALVNTDELEAATEVWGWCVRSLPASYCRSLS